MLGALPLGAHALVGSHVSVSNGAGQHGIERLDVPIREQPGVFQPVTIGRDTWIGERARRNGSVPPNGFGRVPASAAERKRLRTAVSAADVGGTDFG